MKGFDSEKIEWQVTKMLRSKLKLTIVLHNKLYVQFSGTAVQFVYGIRGLKSRISNIYD